MTAADGPVRAVPDARARRRSLRVLALVGAGLALALAVVGSIAIGSGMLPPGEVIAGLLDPGGSITRSTIWSLRVPRTLIGLLVGAALAVAGTLMQGLTRNPLADPGLLGVNAGAAFAVTLAVALLRITDIRDYLVFAFCGAACAAVAVYAIAAQGRHAPTPLRLTLVGLALGAVLIGISQSIALVSPRTFDAMRFWGAGTLADRPAATIGAILPFVAAGLVLGACTTPALNALALGDDLARAMGVPIALVRAGVVVAVVLLCGAATAAAGPIGFLGLMVPHIARWIVGADLRWVLALSLLLGPAVLLAADIAGRLIVLPSELQVGIILPLLGAPVAVALVRRRRVVGL
ncbi:FecCD family ABC transporter permease [Brachybacterium sp. AOP25-B2-12]|uniref:FecCD family ABC transporter permease n=1 Tax=Brachybacterium sp. AOP25-B2-12 TaxID=3457710 RepID=UPI0040333141